MLVVGWGDVEDWGKEERERYTLLVPECCEVVFILGEYSAFLHHFD